MQHLVVAAEMPESVLATLLPSDDLCLVVVRKSVPAGVQLFVVTRGTLRSMMPNGPQAGTVGAMLEELAWCDSPCLPVHNGFDPVSVALHAGERLAGVQWCRIKVALGRDQGSVEETPPCFMPSPAELWSPKTGAEPPPPADEPFEAYPGIRAPETARVGQPMQVDVWLSREPVAGVEGPDGEEKVVMDLEAGVEWFDIDLQVVARGFRAEAPGWRQPLHVNRSRPEQSVAHFSLVPEPQAEAAREASVQVHFAYKGNPCGYFWRDVLVLSEGAEAVPEGEAAAAVMEPAQPQKEEPAVSFRLPVGAEAADLTVRISKADRDHATGLLTWTFESPWPLRLPDTPPETDLGDNCQACAKAIVDLVQQCPEGQSVVKLLRGVAKDLADKIPDDFWRLMDEVRGQVTDRAPSVLILTEEAYVPWELAWVNPAWDPDRPAFLGAQVNLARWILSGSRSGPAQPPRTRVDVEAVTVLAGDYASDSGYRPLPNALAEAKFLEKALKAATFKATEADLDRVLSDDSQATNVLHFACHGEADPRQPEYNRIVLGDNV
ncbi:MAG TPA: CHAT domain-containing protein, partial [Symbiobacteriaceae bacterium]|nr:CHAT domain-containing protein [Symbiobacteriaceae bacterium]